MSSGPRVIIGMSGGVDSSVAALLLKQQGYAVEGLFMKNWEEDDTDSHCSAAVDVQHAESVCNQLDIPLHTCNFSSDYWHHVFEHFLAELRKNRTPNPDVLCNREIKFKVFFEYALSLGADYIATGHYAGKSNSQNDFDAIQLLRAADSSKDQSYFLYAINPKALSKTLFPLQTLSKKEVRRLALEAGFCNATKKDSTGICFIGERKKFKQFLHHYIPAKPGNIETPDKTIIGRHDGLMYYTLGQRQGLGIGGQSNATDSPWYVVAKDVERNVLVVAQGEHHPLLYRNELVAEHCQWITKPVRNAESFSCWAKIRYRQEDQPCRVFVLGCETTNNEASLGNPVSMNKDASLCRVEFEHPQRAITPGQSVVFYNQNICLGGGIIQ